MESTIFSYCLHPKDNVVEWLTTRYKFGKHCISTDDRTPYQTSYSDDVECAILGFAVNVVTGEEDELTKKFIECKNIDEVVEYEKQLGGKYIIFYRNKDMYYVLGDATTSNPIFYSIKDKIYCTNWIQIIIRRNGYSPDPYLKEIRDSGEISQAMPFDITSYCEIKQLLPNHYLDINDRKAVRFVNAREKQKKITVDDATNVVAPMIDVLCNYYKKKFKLYCPITAGRDSRVVMAFLLKKHEPVQCYTIKHIEHKDNEQDIVIPTDMCADMSISHEVIADVEVPLHISSHIDELMGSGNYSQRTLRIAETVREHYKDGAIVNGDIIGQVGKCSLHRDIPPCFATSGYFRCKLHNYSANAKIELGKWLDDIKQSGEEVNTFDLFSIENRMGRWAGKEHLLYGALGQAEINVFNSRSIIYVWTAVSRSCRKKSEIHIDLIKNIMPQLLTFPFEADKEIAVRVSKSSGVSYLMASYAKYYIEKRKYRKGNNDE